ncbi:hypothetical protein BV898_04910 [Hypsibius exemplaris]|uniref:Uncharacterized protein n=1 Tax=Hypsibius exemplaris TaxID=2072580 RepID=A0A1W0X0Y3_HYPEX|nr:hypothetical protein BV898_04910 [Hypsibius exemplaris]
MANPKTTHFPTATYSTANRQVNHALFPAPATSVSSSSSGPANRRTAAPHQDEGQKCIIQRGARPSAAAIPNNHPASSSSPSPSSSSSPYISSSTNGPNSRYYPSRDYYDDTAAGNTFPRQDDYRRRPDHPSTYTTSTQHSNSSGKTRPTTFPLNHYVTNPPSSTAAAAAANSKTSHASTDEDVTPPTLLAGGAVAGKSMNYYYAHDGGSSSGRRDGNDDGRQNSHFHPRSSSSSSAAAAAVLHNSMPQARNSSGGGGGGGTTSIGNNVQSPSPSSPSPQQQQQQNGGGLGYNSDFSLHLHRDTTSPLSMRLSMPFRTAFSRHVGGLGGQQRDNSSGGNNGGGGGRPFGRGDLFREDFMDNDFFDRPFGFTDNPTAAPTGGGGLGRQRSPFLASAFSGAGADDLFAGFDDNGESHGAATFSFGGRN